jgi:putative ABC transport system permease protein
MLKSVLKTCFRNLLKNRRLSIISIGGLSLGVSIFIISLLYVNHEWSYDKGFSDWENIYRVETIRKEGARGLLIPQNAAHVFQMNSPEIKDLTKFTVTSSMKTLLKTSGKSIYISHLYFTDTSFFKIFNFSFVFGHLQDAFSTKKSIVLSKETSRKLFGEEDPTGKIVRIGEDGDFIVSGVFNDQQFATHLSVDAIRQFEPSENPATLELNWSYMYIKLYPNAITSVFEKKLSEAYSDLFANQLPRNSLHANTITFPKKTIRLQPIANIYLGSHSMQEISRNGNEAGILLLICMAVFILLVSAINFMNFSIVEAPSRAKEIAIRRFTGSSGMQILFQLYLEIAIKSVAALLLALLITELALPFISNVLSIRLFLFGADSMRIWIQILGVIGVIVIVGGTYPVLYILHFKTSSILKGGAINGPKGDGLRNILLGVQFMISAVFISGICIITNQVQFLRTKDLGFSPQQVMVINLSKYETQLEYQYIKERLISIPGIAGVSYASAVGEPNEETITHLIVNGGEYKTQYVCVDTSYFNLLNASFFSGGNFPGGISDTSNTIVINRTLANIAGITNVKQLTNLKAFGKQVKVAGIVNDLNFYGFENIIGPMAFVASHRTSTPFILLRLNTKAINETISKIGRIWNNIEAGYPLQYYFLDRSFNEIYMSYDKLTRLFTWITTIALLIALIGLYSLTALITIQRSKEIAIRKVLGASMVSILSHFNRIFFKVVVIANVIAWPVIYFLSQQWLENFAYRTHLSISPFLVATLSTSGLTVLIVCMQTYKVASIPGVEALKQE